jgi:hypothetical protein
MDLHQEVVGSFIAQDDFGKFVEIEITRVFGRNREGVETTVANNLATKDGVRVVRLSRGVYRIEHGHHLTSTDPFAP